MKCVTRVIKMILCLLILFSAAIIGLHLSQRMTRRRDILQCFDVLLHRAATMIEYNAGDLCEVFSDNFAGFEFHHTLPFDIQWERFIMSFSSVLKKDDIALLMDFMKELGQADAEAQRRHIALYSELLREHIEEAQNDINTKAKMVRIVPLSAGVVISLLVI